MTGGIYTGDKTAVTDREGTVPKRNAEFVQPVPSGNAPAFKSYENFVG